MKAYRFYILCACAPEPIYQSVNAYESELAAGRIGYEVWRDFLVQHAATVALQTVQVPDFAAVPALSEERAQALADERLAAIAH